MFIGGEISKLERAGKYPIYDITSSGITQEWDSVEPNSNRIGEVVRDNNVGMIEIEWGEEPGLTFMILDVKMQERVKHEVKLKSYNKNNDRKLSIFNTFWHRTCNYLECKFWLKIVRFRFLSLCPRTQTFFLSISEPIR